MSEYKELDEIKYKKLGESKDAEEKQRREILICQRKMK